MEGASIRWGRVVAATSLLLLFAELVAQVGISVWAGEKYSSLSYYRWSPYGLVRNNPTLTHPQFDISPEGFRDHERYALDKPPHTLRVLMLGGSVLYAGLGRTTLIDALAVDSNSTMAQYLRQAIEADPEFAGLGVEVINSAVNFNRVVETSAAYLAEYIHWAPDLVVVCGSANNFGYMPRAGDVRSGLTPLRTPHPWRKEFERQVNRHDALALFENAWRTLESYLAAPAVVRKVVTKLLDRALTASRAHGPSGRSEEKRFASWSEVDEYVSEYLAYAAAIVAAAHTRDQEVAFFWEYFIAHLGGVREFNPEEQRLFKANGRFSCPEDAEFERYVRNQVGAFCHQVGAIFLDPIEVIRTKPGTLYIDYLHYTAEGNRAFAQFMFRELRPVLLKKAAALR